MTNDESSRKTESSNDSRPESEGAVVGLEAAPSGSPEAVAAESSAGVQGLNPDLLLEDPDTLVVIKRRGKKRKPRKDEDEDSYYSDVDGDQEQYHWTGNCRAFICTYEGSVWIEAAKSHESISNGLINATTRLRAKRMGLKLVDVKHFDRFQDLVSLNHGISGRIFLDPQPQVISFWETRREILRKWMPTIRSMLASMNLSPEQLIWEFIDYKKQFEWGKMSGVGSLKRRTKTEMEELRQLHLNPSLKRAVLPKVNQKAEVAQRAGFDTAASYNSTRVIGDSLLTDPDNWRIRKRLWGNEPESIAPRVAV